MAGSAEADNTGFLATLTPNTTSCQLHPVVLFEILDHYTRRNVDQGRVIGALLGSHNSDGTITLKNSFPMMTDMTSHPEFAQFFSTMWELHQKVNSREQLVGWYVTARVGESDANYGSTEVGEEDAPLHAFFEDKVGEKSPCLMLKVDANIVDASKIGVSAYTSSAMVLRGSDGDAKVLGRCFNRVSCDIRTYEAQRIGVDFITQNTIGQGGGEELGSDMEKLEGAMLKLISMVETTIEHVDGVVEGREKADTQVGRALAEAVSHVPNVDPAEFEGAFSKRVQDLLMVHYLGAIARSQVAFWQRMQSM
mmetsp:Transcript_57849/g.141880  ORF Transcript_57849/g.141880 Transcript_57849/m.141880 type:complete len:308 (+) Transcript_57849:67-990(+)|eukprot:CAMPEP_0206235988 /NCGR_PEP_ID=MMETSP0047_2-20121206/13461_1 /ASSEMBLY_ACC=CAM_ASM_000192 /TAXON_ID=195065 /ORGANISM="Chroomonas mesostigmatica_cf, Strain CCMP1168" /LENGTH=307 /DNA_ID=CAMNT_0053660265 /DNA_START=60 /DNA_END=983 /DNA_ORIENTATION=-